MKFEKKQMKRIVAALLCMVMVCLVACCSSCSEPEDQGIELTLENYDDYFEVDGNVKAGSTTRCMSNDEWVYLCDSLKCDLSISGNSNYEYKDVTIGVRFYHYQPLVGTLVSEETVYINLNLAGNGETTCTLKTPIADEEGDDIPTLIATFYSSRGLSSALEKTGYEVVSIEGRAIKNE